MPEKRFCTPCNKETFHYEDIELFIHKPIELQNYTVYICEYCWNGIYIKNKK